MHRRRPTRDALALLLLAAAAATGSSAAAEEPQPLPCTRFDHLAGFLEQTYGERPVAAGLQSNGQLLQVFVSGADGDGSWTAVATSPAGTACVVATGRHWEQAAGGGEPAVAAEGGAVRVPAAARP